MKYGTSMRGRTLVGRLERGEELIDAITRLCHREKVQAGVFSALGSLSEAELKTYDSELREYVSVVKTQQLVEVASLTGNVSTVGPELVVQASALLVAESLGQVQVLGGHIASAKAYALEFSLQVFDDLQLERTFDVATGLPLWNRILPRDPYLARAAAQDEPQVRVHDSDADQASNDIATDASQPQVHVATEPKTAPTIIRRGAPQPPTEPDLDDDPEDDADDDDEGEAETTSKRPRPAPAAAWNDAVRRVSLEEPTPSPPLDIPEGGSRADEDDPFADESLEDYEDYELEAGDVLEHPTLGRCSVIRVEDEEWAFIKSSRKRGKTQKLALRVFDLEHVGPAPDGEHEIYKLVRARRR